MLTQPPLEVNGIFNSSPFNVFDSVRLFIDLKLICLRFIQISSSRGQKTYHNYVMYDCTLFVINLHVNVCS